MTWDTDGIRRFDIYDRLNVMVPLKIGPLVSFRTQLLYMVFQINGHICWHTLQSSMGPMQSRETGFYHAPKRLRTFPFYFRIATAGYIDFNITFTQHVTPPGIYDKLNPLLLIRFCGLLWGLTPKPRLTMGADWSVRWWSIETTKPFFSFQIPWYLHHDFLDFKKLRALRLIWRSGITWSKQILKDKSIFNV